MTIILVLICGDHHRGGEMSGVRSAPSPQSRGHVHGGGSVAGRWGVARPPRGWRLRPGVGLWPGAVSSLTWTTGCRGRAGLDYGAPVQG